jgi:hypothetical protein
MSVNVNVNGTSYPIPTTTEKGWGDQVTNWIRAISQHTLQKNSTVFTLSAELDWGGAYGLKALYLKSRTANAAGSGAVRLAASDSISFRNAGNTADLELKLDGSNNLQFNGEVLGTKAAADALDARMDAAESGITNLDTRLDAAEPAIASLQSADVALDTRLDTLEAAVPLKALDSVVVKTVNGQSPTAGAVTVTTSNVSEGSNLYYTDVRADARVAVHTGTATGAHNASAIAVTGSITNLTATNVQSAIAELQADIDTRAYATSLTLHTGAASGAHAASAISVAGGVTGLSATDVQAALAELQGDINGLSASSQNVAVSTKTAAYTITGSDGLILANATSAAFTLTLPSASGNTGKVLRIKKTDSSANAVTVSGTIDGGSSFVIGMQYEAVTLISDGASSWHIV